MTPKEQVKTVYPKAYSYRISSWLYHIRSGTDTPVLAWGDNPRQAWGRAADRFSLAIKVKQKLNERTKSS